MQGETTVDERAYQQLRWLDQVRDKYATHITGLDKKDWAEDLISQLIFDATYLATYHGIDLDTLIQETVQSTRRHFPDIC